MQRTSKLKVNFYTICAILAGLMLFGHTNQPEI